VRGNGKIIQELEAIFRGAGWNVIKLIWGGDWDPLIQAIATACSSAAWAKSPTDSIRNISSRAARISARIFSAPIPGC
jgi:pyruvate dehydrogenase complex dehydrogenase (E1) component